MPPTFHQCLRSLVRRHPVTSFRASLSPGPSLPSLMRTQSVTGYIFGCRFHHRRKTSRIICVFHVCPLAQVRAAAGLFIFTSKNSLFLGDPLVHTKKEPASQELEADSKTWVLKCHLKAQVTETHASCFVRTTTTTQVVPHPSSTTSQSVAHTSSSSHHSSTSAHHYFAFVI